MNYNVGLVPLPCGEGPKHTLMNGHCMGKHYHYFQISVSNCDPGGAAVHGTEYAKCYTGIAVNILTHRSYLLIPVLSICYGYPSLVVVLIFDQ